MVVWLTNTLFVVEGVYQTVADHMQPSGEAQQATHNSHSTLLKLQQWLRDL